MELLLVFKRRLKLFDFFIKMYTNEQVGNGAGYA